MELEEKTQILCNIAPLFHSFQKVKKAFSIGFTPEIRTYIYTRAICHTPFFSC
jgi:hypothetical protein